MSEETQHLAVCAASSSALAEIAGVVRESGAWNVLPVEWPDANALIEVRPLASAYVLHVGDAPDPGCEELIRLLGARPPHTPLLVIGVEPASAARPSVWLPALPSPGQLGQMIHSLLDHHRDPNAAPAPTWRRKS